MESIRTGIVIGSYNMPDVLRIQLACIRDRCGPDVPVLMSDDCSDGCEVWRRGDSSFGMILELVRRTPNCLLWPNESRIGHAGGDMAAFWKGIVWGAATGLDVVFKLSQRFIVDRRNWVQEGARLLLESGCSTLGRTCAVHGYDLRTEAVGMNVEQWNRPDVLGDLKPRAIGEAAETCVWRVVRDRLDGRLCAWPVMSAARPVAIPGVLFREANSPNDYAQLAQRYGLTGLRLECRDSNQLANYRMG